MIRVLLVDDQAVVRLGFRMVLDGEPDMEVVGEAADGIAAVDAVAARPVDVVVMDIRMPLLDGIAATERIVETHPATKVLVVTTFDLDEYVLGALRAGASGFLLKDAEPQALLDAVRTVARGEALVAPAVTRTLIDYAFASGLTGRPAVNPDVLDVLTDREREILVQMARGMSNAELAKALFLGETTVKTHVSNLLTKLHLRSRVQAVVLAYETGLVTPGNLTHDDLL
jgi:DNA-binding NarL/FixJ family response regulator